MALLEARSGQRKDPVGADGLEGAHSRGADESAARTGGFLGENGGVRARSWERKCSRAC